MYVTNGTLKALKITFTHLFTNETHIQKCLHAVVWENSVFNNFHILKFYMRKFLYNSVSTKIV